MIAFRKDAKSKNKLKSNKNLIKKVMRNFKKFKIKYNILSKVLKTNNLIGYGAGQMVLPSLII